MENIALFFLGSPRIERAAEPVSMDTRKAMALIAYLAIEDRAIGRDTLATIFWPNSNQTRARGALRRTLSTLRKSVGPHIIVSQGENISIANMPNLWLDVDQFHNLIAQSQVHAHGHDKLCPICLNQLNDAVTLYRNDFLTGFTLRDSSRFDQWQSMQTESLRREFSDILERLVNYHGQVGEYDQAIEYAQRWLPLDPLCEAPNFQLMTLYASSGQRSAALRQYAQYVEILKEELGATPQDQIKQLYREIRDNEFEALPAGQFKASQPKLPLQPTRFIGRESELIEIGSILDDSSTRLVTLVGPGGIGKTRLALQVAATKISSFSHGVNFVPLASINSPNLLVPTIADALDFAFYGNTHPITQLFNFLQGKNKLLVLDNFEHLLTQGGTDLLIDMLSTVSGVKLLVTSRERLNVNWELPYEVKGLQVPGDNFYSSIDECSSIQLFMQSANRAKPGISFSNEEEACIIKICKDLGGLPLGIELAASWLNVASCQEISQQISHDLEFLTSTRRDIPARHRSLRAVFEHSWNLLSEEEKGILSKLTVFQRGFTRDAGEQITAATLYNLSSLLNKSFLMRDPNGRYDMLEILRQYAEEKFQLHPITHHQIRDRHSAYYSTFLHQRENYLNSAKEQEAFSEIAQEIDNIRTAWRWAISQKRGQQISDSIESLCRFFNMRSWYQEGRETLGMAKDLLNTGDDLEDIIDQQDLLFAKVLTRYGWMCAKLYDFDSSIEALTQSLAISRNLDALDEVGLALNHLGIVTAMQDNLDEAKKFFEKSLEIYRTLEIPWGIANSLNSLGLISTIKKSYKEAKVLLEESLVIRRTLGYQSSILDSLINLEIIADELGELEESRQYQLECIKIAEEIDDYWAYADGHSNLGFALCGLNLYKEARECSLICLEKVIEVGALKRCRIIQLKAKQPNDPSRY